MAIRRYAGVEGLLVPRALIFVAQPQSAAVAEQPMTERVAAAVYYEQRRPRGHPQRPRSVAGDPPAAPIPHSVAAVAAAFHFHRRWGGWAVQVRWRAVLSIFFAWLLRGRRASALSMSECALLSQVRGRAAHNLRHKTQIRRSFERGQSPEWKVSRKDCRSQRRVGLDREEPS